MDHWQKCQKYDKLSLKIVQKALKWPLQYANFQNENLHRRLEKKWKPLFLEGSAFFNTEIAEIQHQAGF